MRTRRTVTVETYKTTIVGCSKFIACWLRRALSQSAKTLILTCSVPVQQRVSTPVSLQRDRGTTTPTLGVKLVCRTGNFTSCQGQAVSKATSAHVTEGGPQPEGGGRHNYTCIITSGGFQPRAAQKHERCLVFVSYVRSLTMITLRP